MLIEINLKVYDVITWSNKNLLTNFASYLEKEKSNGIKTLTIDRELNQEHFYRAENVHQKLAADLFNFGI